MPLVSVIVPVYNVEDFLRQCLESIVQQSFRDFEIIIVDDGSTDSSRSIAEEYKKNILISESSLRKTGDWELLEIQEF